MVFLGFGMTLSVFGILLSMAIVNYLGVNGEKDFIGAVWRLIFFGMLIITFPMAIAVELVFSRWKKRKLNLHNIALVGLMLGEGMTVLVGVGLVLEVLFPSLSFTDEPFPGMIGLALGLLIGLPAIVIGLTSRTKIGRRVKRAFE